MRHIFDKLGTKRKKPAFQKSGLFPAGQDFFPGGRNEGGGIDGNQRDGLVLLPCPDKSERPDTRTWCTECTLQAEGFPARCMGSGMQKALYLRDYSAPKKRASGGKVSHLESGLRMRFAPSFLGSKHIRI
ncbi:hypothetical protein SAMN05216233_105177 [Desulfoluna spongiiphila]|uniref:Uncharacterized protein n=1 Tax=Desulfoluna spongiiphila TaxID=419481 RepID=A0A1G5E6I2_9BACT|nr:hypothetical protein SAMN05216233_105177 [Desulfoluna spongiiphila]